jgi:uracil-DNA glycosylase
MKGVFDFNKPLHVVQDEWDGCTDCSLGELRNLRGGQQVFGAGTGKRGILFVGSEIGLEEEREGRPVADKAGRFLARILQRYRITNFFVTNLTACRSCAPLLDDAGQPYMTKGYGGRAPEPRYKDQAALKPHLDACANRVYEEIYLIDPILIVAMGQLAAATLRGGSFNLTRERGYSEEIEVPGAGVTAVLSPKLKEWKRKVKGQLVAPVARSKVKYLMLPTLHPKQVREAINDRHNGNPFELFTKDIRTAKMLFDTYNEELHGQTPDDMRDLANTPYELADEFIADDEAQRNGE